MTYLLAFAVSLGFVFTKSFQQLNVQHDRFRWILPCSLAMALMEVTGILLIVRSDSVLIFIPIGCGSSLGCVAAMLIHKRLRNVPKSRHYQTRVDDSRGIEIDGDLCNEWR